MFVCACRGICNYYVEYGILFVCLLWFFFFIFFFFFFFFFFVCVFDILKVHKNQKKKVVKINHLHSYCSDMRWVAKVKGWSASVCVDLFYPIWAESQPHVHYLCDLPLSYVNRLIPLSYRLNAKKSVIQYSFVNRSWMQLGTWDTYIPSF